jgi:hypothetical protein
LEGAILIYSRDNEVADDAARIVTSECISPANNAIRLGLSEVSAWMDDTTKV